MKKYDYPDLNKAAAIAAMVDYGVIFHEREMCGVILYDRQNDIFTIRGLPWMTVIERNFR